jgi:uncharacterized protein YidB (DUF937 family)
MSLLNMLGSVLGNAESGGQQQNVLSAVTEFINKQPGGSQGLVQTFEQQGAGGVIQSWIGSGENQPVSPAALQDILGSSAVSELAGKIGVSPEQASGLLAQVLPHVVNHATPDGEVPQSGQIDTASVLGSLAQAGGLGSLVEGFLGKKEG